MSSSSSLANSSSAQSPKEELKQQAQTLVDDVREFGVIGKRAAEDVADSVRTRANEVKGETVAKAGDFEAQVIEYVTKQPIKAIFLAAGAGALATMWLGRK